MDHIVGIHGMVMEVLLNGGGLISLGGGWCTGGYNVHNVQGLGTVHEVRYNHEVDHDIDTTYIIQ